MLWSTNVCTEQLPVSRLDLLATCQTCKVFIPSVVIVNITSRHQESFPTGSLQAQEQKCIPPCFAVPLLSLWWQPSSVTIAVRFLPHLALMPASLIDAGTRREPGDETAMAASPSGRQSRVLDFLLQLMQPGTQRRYRERLADLDRWCKLVGCCWQALPDEELDFLLCDYCLDGRDLQQSPQAFSETVAAVNKHFAHRRKCPAAQRVLAGWRLDNPPEQAPPVSEETAMAMVSLLTVCFCGEEATALLLCFCGLLRISEALALRRDDVVFTWYGNAAAVVLLLKQSKRGALGTEKVVLTNPSVVTYLQHHLLGPRGTACAVCNTSYARVQRAIGRASTCLGLAELGLRSHSFRRGAASTLALRGWNIRDIMMAGRWASESSAKLYIQKGEVLLMRMDNVISPNNRRHIQLLASAGPHLHSILRVLPAEPVG